MHDVLVVGGSVAGATTATYLARRGHSVRLIDRATFPRRKPCGEGIFYRGVQVLAGLGLLDDLMPRAAALSMLQLRLGDIWAEAPIRWGSEGAIGMRREVLDEALLNLAAASGVEVEPPVAAQGLIASRDGFSAVQTDKGKMAARVIVAADGLRSRLRRQAGLDLNQASRRLGVTAHYELPAPPPPRIEVHFQQGYEVYVTPVGDHLVNVALLLGRSEAARLSGQVETAFQAMLGASGALPEDARLMDEPMVSAPFPASATRAWRDNLVLVGDAAGFFDGVSGDGISLALQGAKRCAAAVHGYLCDGESRHFAAYHRDLRAAARNSTLLARFVLRLASHPAIGRRVLANLRQQPRTLARLVEVSQARRSFAGLRPRDLLALALGV
jgi:flavin-dependent dehydrogenase